MIEGTTDLKFADDASEVAEVLDNAATEFEDSADEAVGDDHLKEAKALRKVAEQLRKTAERMRKMKWPEAGT